MRHPENIAERLRERVYGDIACLGTVLALAGRAAGPEEGAGAPWEAVVGVAVTVGGLWAANVFSHYVAHLAVHGRGPRGAEALRVLRASGEILQAAVIPLVLLVAGAIGWIPPAVALSLTVWGLVVGLGVIAALAVRRVPVPWWQRLVLVAALVAVGAAVVAVKSLH